MPLVILKPKTLVPVPTRFLISNNPSSYEAQYGRNHEKPDWKIECPGLKRGKQREARRSYSEVRHELGGRKEPEVHGAPIPDSEPPDEQNQGSQQNETVTITCEGGVSESSCEVVNVDERPQTCADESLREA